jgi:hypothetical protein
MDSWVANYIGIPFETNGRTRDACDCYGLVRLVLLECESIRLPLLLDDYTDALNLAETRKIVTSYAPLLLGERVNIPRIRDIAVMRCAGSATHFGVYAGDGFILHTLSKTGSIIERISSFNMNSRLEGFYRVSENYRTASPFLVRSS